MRVSPSLVALCATLAALAGCATRPVNEAIERVDPAGGYRPANAPRPDPRERSYFLNLPTSFVLPAEAVDRLREVAGRLLRESTEFQALVKDLGGAPAAATGTR